MSDEILNPTTTTLEEARQFLRDRLYSGGAKCPCCNRHAKVYKRSITSSMCWGLAEIYAAYQKDWVHISKFLKANDRVSSSVRGDMTKFKYWGIMMPHDDKAAVWHVTGVGESFLNEGLEVPKSFHVYDEQILKQSDEKITFEAASKNSFDYEEIINNPASRLS